MQIKKLTRSEQRAKAIEKFVNSNYGVTATAIFENLGFDKNSIRMQTNSLIATHKIRVKKYPSVVGNFKPISVFYPAELI